MKNHTSAYVHMLGDNISTDDIIAGKYKHATMDLARLSEHAFESLVPGFGARIASGDYLAAGANFGCGSSREQAPLILKQLGIAAVLAPSFARIFFRNSINIGLPVLICDISRIHEGDRLHYDPVGHHLYIQGKEELALTPYPDQILSIVREGGLLAYVRSNGGL